MNLGPLEPKAVDLVIAVVCFSLVFGILAKVLLPRISRTLAEREDAIAGNNERAEATRIEAERIHDEYKHELAEAYREIAHTRQEASEQGALIIAAARDEGARQRDALVAAAHAQIEVDRTLAAAALNESVRRLAVELASRIVGEPLEDFADRSEIVDRYFDELEADSSVRRAAS
ncbi:F0F1 ATP synthase subunit B [Streptomyces prasinus]|uniref:F0F1 ATP synthase subunit B family protein n=2 Tax=Streptomyces prasinus TaxID=67345 RepID=UPI00362B8094